MRKVAIVSTVWTAYVYRLMLGALSFAETRSKLVTRDFRLPPGSQLDSTNPQSVLNQLVHWEPDGVLSYLESRQLEQLIQSFPQSPCIVSMCVTKSPPGVARVVGNRSVWLETGIRHLRQQGLRTFACLTLDEMSQERQHNEIFNKIARPRDPDKATLVEPVDPLILDNPYAPVAPVPAKVAAWLRQLPKPVGVFCPNLGGGGYLIRVCHELGLRVPADVAVVGADDTDLAIANEPTLTTVLPAAQHIGREAMRMLAEMMSGKPAPSETLRLDTMDLHVRESTSSRRTDSCDIGAALEYISRHGRRGVSVEQVIKETQHVSKVTFHKNFKAATGRTPGEAIQQRQMEEAQRLLAKTQLSVTTIAENCGFCDSSTFAHRFRAVQGKSPMEFRKQARGKREG